MKLSDLKNKTIIIFGFGKEGQATFEVLKKHDLPVAAIVDDTPVETGRCPVSTTNAARGVFTGTQSNNLVIIKSPGIKPDHPFLIEALGNGAIITSPTNLFLAERKGKGMIIGITGTKGKTTTTSLLAAVMKAAGRPVELVGNVGIPMMDFFDAPVGTEFVVELSSYHLHDLTTAPDIGVILNLYEEHMDWHGSVEAYQQAKLNLGKIMDESDILVYNAEFPALLDLAVKIKATAIPFKDDPALLDHLQLLGVHNRMNARAVITVADLLGIDHSVIASTFETFKAIRHRLEIVGEFDGLTYVNDSISTTPQSAVAAIDVFDSRLSTIILGGFDRGYHFAPLIDRLKRLPDVQILVMPGGERLASELQAEGIESTPIIDLKEAVTRARWRGKPGQVVLMSPSSPSYGQFKNFEERGDRFVEAVKVEYNQ